MSSIDRFRKNVLVQNHQSIFQRQKCFAATELHRVLEQMPFFAHKIQNALGTVIMYGDERISVQAGQRNEGIAANRAQDFGFVGVFDRLKNEFGGLGVHETTKK